jgi:hypothetical protein
MLEAEIFLQYEDKKFAKAVAKAVSPDNFKVPKGLWIKTTLKDKTVLTRIKCDKKITTLIATIDDLLFSVSTAEKTLAIAETLNGPQSSSESSKF